MNLLDNLKGCITVGILKEIIKDLPDDMIIGGSGHFGEFLEAWYIDKKRVNKDGKSVEILCISMESAGEEPD